MPGLFAAYAVPCFQHIFIHVSVSHGGLDVIHPRILQGAVKTKVGHDGGHHSIVHQFPIVFHHVSENIEDMVTVHHVSVTVHRDASVSVTVKGKSQIQFVFTNVLHQCFNMSGSRTAIDVQTVGGGIDH